jgi:excisionase family DNA binding protein
MVQTPELLTVPEAARRLSLGRATTYQLVRRGELPSVRVGRAVRVPARALDAWIAAHTTGGAIDRFDHADR